ncbi:MAG: hypothetical protein M1829_001233 [Trizodia sp. TS-e1964]|nr:MAG: hypothetical protein M1829_001233 [Trizodia sp. TS-e1964]
MKYSSPDDVRAITKAIKYLTYDSIDTSILESHHTLSIPRSQIDQLDDLLDDDEKQFPWISYNAVKEKFTIRTLCFTPIHRAIIPTFYHGFYNLEHTLPPSLVRRLLYTSDSMERAFLGPARSSFRTASFVLHLNSETSGDAGGIEPRFVVEIGYNDPEQEMHEAVRLWLGYIHTVQKVFLIRIAETPKWRDPTLDLSNEDRRSLFLDTVSSSPDWNAEIPKQLKQYSWINQISIWLEVWVRDPLTGKAMQEGERIDLRSRSPEFPSVRLGELVYGGPNPAIPLPWYDMNPRLDDMIEEMACHRCRRAAVPWTIGEGTESEKSEGEEI